MLHGSYFLFIHFTESFHKVPPGLDWFRAPYLLAGLTVVALEIGAFTLTVRSDNAAPTTRSMKSRQRR